MTRLSGVGQQGPTGPGTAAEVLVVEDVSVTLGGRVVLDHVSFTLHAGEFTGLIGSNGAGKTTLLRVILGLQKPSAGRVTLSGHGADPHGAGPHRAGRDPRDRSHKREIGYVPQKVLLDPDIPVRARDLVALGIDGHRFGLPRRSRQRSELVEEMLEAVDARSFADSRVGRLSGGEQQRVLIAHALISRPKLLLLDEPLANLDIRSGQEIIDLLQTISGAQEVAVLLSAHEMNPLLPAMDRVVYIAAGKAANGSTDEVIRADVLSRLYGHHVDVLRVHGRILVVSGVDSAPDEGHSAEVG